jgi:WD40 repeat protein
MLVSQRSSGWGSRVKIMRSYASRATVFSPDSRFILCCFDTAELWDVATGTLLHRTPITTLWCLAVAFSPDGQSIACAFLNGAIIVWTIAPWAMQAVLHRCSNDEIRAVTFTPDSQSVVSAFEDGTVRVRSLTQQPYQVFTTGVCINDHAAVVFSLDCRFMAVTKCNDGAARVWKLIPGAPPEPVIVGLGNGKYLAAAFSPDGCTIVFGSQDHGIHVWDTATGTQRSTINGHSDGVTAVAFSRDGQFLVSGSNDTTILVWNFTTGAQQPDYVLKGHHRMVESVAFSPDAKLVLSSSADRTMRVWSGAIGVDESVMEGHTGAVTTIAFSHDGRHIASGSVDSTIRVWDAAIGRQKYVLEGHEHRIRDVVFSPDSQTIASSSADHTVRIWDVVTGTQVHALLHNPWHPSNVVFSYDGQSVVVVSGADKEDTDEDADEDAVHELHVWEVATGMQKFVISYSQLELSQDPDWVAFSPSDQLVVAAYRSKTTSSQSWGSATGTDYKVWDASTGIELAVQDLTPALARDMDGALLSRNKQAVAPYHTRMDDGWIEVSQDKYNWHRMCWLPAERQMILSSTYAYHGQKVCIGASSGAVTILDWSNVPMSHQEKPKPRVARVDYGFYTGLHLACSPEPEHTPSQILIQN